VADPRYLDIQDELMTGDLVLFEGSSNTSDLIKRFTFTRWSHVGMVLRVPGYEQPFVWESLRTAAIPDAMDGQMKSGVQLLDLRQRVTHCTDPMAVRRLNKHVSPVMHAAALGFRELVRNRPYEQNLSELVFSAYDGPMGDNEEDLSSIFCSELIAEAYQRMGLLTCNTQGGEASNEYTPAFFAGPDTLPLLGDYQLGPVQVIHLK